MTDEVTAMGAPVTGASRIAMWSGPRTISTALMRAWENRPDTVVVDEPLYGFYLARSGVPHPGREEIITSMPGDWPVVLDQLAAAPLPDGKTVYYQKHMTHHLLPEVDRGAHPGVRGEQLEIFRLLGGPVVDAGDVLRRPRPMLEALCDALGVRFDPAMLSWPAGPRPTDGVWARHWYDGVWRSTGFGPYRESTAALPPALEPLARECQRFYDEMYAHRIVA